MRKSSRLLTLILSLSLTLPTLAEAAISREAMADAMLQMMEAMGFFGSEMAASVGSMSGSDAPALPMTMPGWPSPFNALSGGTGIPSGLPLEQEARRFAQSMTGSGGMPWGASALEGIWESNDGGLLIVQGGFYRIYAPRSGSVDGSIRVASDRVELTNPREGITHQFEFALDQGRLALRDRTGQIFLYRRLVLDGVGIYAPY